MTTRSDSIDIAIINYPTALQSAVFGLHEVFSFANQICDEHQLLNSFDIEIITLAQIEESTINNKHYSAIILPPSISNEFYLNPAPALKQWLLSKHNAGSILCSVCAGAFILADTGLLDRRDATTHWGLIAAFKEHHPTVLLDTDKIIVNGGDIISAGGMMSWLDLSLELVAQFTKPSIMRQLGKVLVVDTGQREQRYYRQFAPIYSHGDKIIARVQRKIQKDYRLPLKVSKLASFSCLTERTFLRHFVKATGMKPREYIQRIRVQKACDLLENSNDSFETIANNIGYEDLSACRRIFVKIMGLPPGEFRKRFVNTLQ